MKKYRFLGWQHISKAKGEVFFALFNIVDPASRFNGSTVSLQTLLNSGYFAGPAIDGFVYTVEPATFELNRQRTKLRCTVYLN